MNITIDEEFSKLLPPLSDDEYAGLEQSLKAEGCRDALVVWNHEGQNILIDGHNRYKICQKYGIEFRTVEKKFESREDVQIWMIHTQAWKRNIDKWQKFDLYKRLEQLEQTKAKDRQRGGQGGTLLKEKFPEAKLETDDSGEKTNNQSEEPHPSVGSDRGQVRDKIGKLIGVSGRTYDKMKAIDEKATERTKELVRKGELSINQAYNSVHPKRPDPVKQAKKEHEEFEKKKSEKTVSIRDAQIDKINSDIIDTAMLQDVLRSLNAVDNIGVLYAEEKLRKLRNLMSAAERTNTYRMCEQCINILQTIQRCL